MNEFMRVLKKYRLLVLLTVVVGALWFFTNVVFASESVLVDETVTVDIPEPPLSSDYENAFIYRLPNGQYMCVVHNNARLDFSLDTWSDGTDCYSYYVAEYQRYVYCTGWSGWSFYDEGFNTDFSFYQSFLGVCSVDEIFDYLKENTVYSDTGLYDSENLVFFCQPRQIQTIKTIGGLTSQSLTSLLTREMVGLIPLVIGLVVSVIAFYKGWKMLRQVLLMA